MSLGWLEQVLGGDQLLIPRHVGVLSAILQRREQTTVRGSSCMATKRLHVNSMEEDGTFDPWSLAYELNPCTAAASNRGRGQVPLD